MPPAGRPEFDAGLVMNETIPCIYQIAAMPRCDIAHPALSAWLLAVNSPGEIGTLLFTGHPEEIAAATDEGSAFLSMGK